MLNLGQRCALDLCVRPHVQLIDELLQARGHGVSHYLPEERQYWKDRGQLRHTPSITSAAQCVDALQKYSVVNRKHLTWPFRRDGSNPQHYRMPKVGGHNGDDCTSFKECMDG